MAMRSVVEACVRLTPAAGMHTCTTKVSALGQAEDATIKSYTLNMLSSDLGKDCHARRGTHYQRYVRTSLTLRKVCLHASSDMALHARTSSCCLLCRGRMLQVRCR